MLQIIADEMDIEAHIKNWTRYTPFETLVRTILSQNTTDKTSFKAFDRLMERYPEFTPENMAGADVEDIAEAIRIAGLYQQKSERIKEVARIIAEEWDPPSNFQFMLSAPLHEARAKLMALPGIGTKTADVVLNFVAQRPIMPVDTHITRISKRIGLVPHKAKYDEIREAIEASIPEEQIFTIHVSLIFFGRKVCRARDPQCPTCPVAQLCPKLIERKKARKRTKKPSISKKN